MGGCGMQNFCAIITKIESSIYKLVEQNMIISVCNHILFEETVSKSNFILTLLYLHIQLMYTRQKKETHHLEPFKSQEDHK